MGKRQYTIRTTCEVCNAESWQTVAHPCRLRKTCSERCHRALVGENCHKKQPVDPTPEEIAEICSHIRTGRLKIVGTQVVRDFECKPRRNVASTFVRVTSGALNGEA